jgi:hypothetical protein
VLRESPKVGERCDVTGNCRKIRIVVFPGCASRDQAEIRLIVSLKVARRALSAHRPHPRHALPGLKQPGRKAAFLRPTRLPYWCAYEDGAWELAIRVSACADNCYCSCSIDGFVVMRSSLQGYLTPLHAALPCIRRGTRHNLYHAAGGGVAHSLRISG